MRIDRPVGIDLGTTNSEIAVLDPSEAQIHLYVDRFGRKTMPSAVAYDPKEGKWLVGHAARSRRGKDPSPIESIKRKMGQRTVVKLGPFELSPEEVSSKILTELVERLREQLQAKTREGMTVAVTRAVITVPAYFDAPQVEATKRAGELAGLEVIGVLQEPTAAAMVHVWKHNLGDGNYLVYDLGGGTFDVSIVRVVAGEYQVLAIEGDNYLGGDDFDRRFAEHMREQLCGQGYDLNLDVLGSPDDARRFVALMALSQQVKESLTTGEFVPVSRQDVTLDRAGESVSVDFEVSRERYEALISDLVDKTIGCAEKALAHSKANAQVGIENIDRVMLVGGSTRVPLVRRAVEKLASTCKNPDVLADDVDASVALGAALYAAQLGGFRISSDAASLSIVTSMVTKSNEIRIGVKFERVPEGCTSVRIETADVVVATIGLPFDREKTERLTIALGEANEVPVEAAFIKGQMLLDTLQFAVYRGEAKSRASGLSRPSVLAKDVFLEVVRSGRRDRKLLMAKGMSLPGTIEQSFATTDQSGLVVLRLLQGRLPIKTLAFEVPATLAVGTEVLLRLKCSEAMTLEAEAIVSGARFWAQVEPADLVRFQTKEGVEKLLERGEGALRNRVSSELERLELNGLVLSVREALRTDPDKLESVGQRLCWLLDSLGDGDGSALSPHIDRFLDEVAFARSLVYRNDGTMFGLSREDWESKLTALEGRGREAYYAEDAPMYKEANREAEALRRTIARAEAAQADIDSPAYIARWVESLQAYGRRVRESLGEFAVSDSAEVAAAQKSQLEVLGTTMAREFEAPLSVMRNEPAVDRTGAPRARQRLADIETVADRVAQALERLGRLGVVAE
jgi:molecular chaperone DnaK